MYGENCAQCHAADLQGGQAPSPYDAESQWPAPNLATFADRYEENPNVVDTEDYREESIIHGRPGTPMRAFGGEAGPLTDEQVEDVVLYILESQEPVGPGETEGEADGEDADGAEDAADTAAADGEELATADMSGEELYANNCLDCHGAE